MYIPDLGLILSTTSDKVAVIMPYLFPFSMWLAGIAIVGVVAIAVFVAIKEFFRYIFLQRKNPQDYGERWGRNMRSMRRAGYEEYYDPVSDRRYFKLGSHKVNKPDYD